ncbi:MAG TPA: hypothetical protein VFD43_05895 [Planctomycetota bacterium]|nr:hypothetical protein [Planctomycetota bacterium]
MRRCIRAMAGILATVVTMAWSAGTQTIPSQLTHSFPFGPCQDVLPVSDRTYMASGGAIYVIDNNTTNPQLFTGLPNKLISGGYTWQLGVSTNMLYAAAGKVGVTRFRRSDHAKLSGAVISGAEARVINVVEFAGDNANVVFVGTSVEDPGTGNVTGEVRLYKVGNGGEDALDLQGSPVPTGTRVTALASYKHSAGTKLTLLVGTACHSTAAGPAVLRFDFDITGDVAPTSIPASIGNWTSLGPCGAAPGTETPQNTFVRDIEIDPLTDTAYVAAYSRGVHRLTLPAGGGITDSNYGSSGWPIIAACSVTERYLDVDFVQMSGGQKLLLVARGGGDEARVWGVCGTPDACDDVEDGRRLIFVSDVALWDVSAGPPVALASIESKPSRAMVRPGNTFPLSIDIAGLQNGLSVVRATSSQLILMGAYDKVDGVPLGSKAQVELIGANYLVAEEIGLAAFDATKAPSDPTLLQDKLAFDGHGAILLSGYAQSPGLPSIVFARGLTEFLLYHVATGGPGGTASGISYMGQLPTEGRGYGLKAVAPSLTPNGRGWIVATNSVDYESAAECAGEEVGRSGLRIWYVINNETNPGIEDLALMGKFVSQVCQPDPGGVFLDCLVDYPGTGNAVSIWVTYGFRGPLNAPVEPTVGLAVFSGDVTYYQGRAWIDIQFVGKVPLCAVPPVPPCSATILDSNVGFLTRSGNTIYAAFGCNGIATFATAPPGVLPTLTARWEDPHAGNHKRVAFQARLIEEGAISRLYVPFLDAGIGVFQPVTLQFLGEIQTPGQPLMVVQAPPSAGSPLKPAMIVTDSASGLHRIEDLLP